MGSSWREHSAAYIQARGKVEDKGVSAILSCTKSPLRLEWGNPVCLGSIVWNLLLEIGTYALSFKRLHTDQSFKNKAGRRKGGDSFYYIMPWYSKYMLRKWEAWVPLPPQPEGFKPMSPTSHKSALTTRLEATLGGGSSTPALKLHHSAARNLRLMRGVRGGSEGARACLRNLELRPVTREWEPWALSSHSPDFCCPRTIACWLQAQSRISPRRWMVTASNFLFPPWHHDSRKGVQVWTTNKWGLSFFPTPWAPFTLMALSQGTVNASPEPWRVKRARPALHRLSASSAPGCMEMVGPSFTSSPSAWWVCTRAALITWADSKHSYQGPSKPLNKEIPGFFMPGRLR